MALNRQEALPWVAGAGAAGALVAAYYFSTREDTPALPSGGAPPSPGDPDIASSIAEKAVTSLLPELPPFLGPGETGFVLDRLRDAWNQLYNDTVGKSLAGPVADLPQILLDEISIKYAEWRDWYREASQSWADAAAIHWGDEFSRWLEYYGDEYNALRHAVLTSGAQTRAPNLEELVGGGAPGGARGGSDWWWIPVAIGAGVVAAGGIIFFSTKAGGGGGGDRRESGSGSGEPWQHMPVHVPKSAPRRGYARF